MLKDCDVHAHHIVVNVLIYKHFIFNKKINILVSYVFLLFFVTSF